MSSDEDDWISDDGSAYSEEDVPKQKAPKAKVAAKKATTTTTKPKQTKAKDTTKAKKSPSKPKKDATKAKKSPAKKKKSKDSDDEESETESPAPKKKAKSQAAQDDRTYEEIYQKKTPLEHILLRPDSYVGSIERQDQTLWVYDEGVGMNYRNVSYVPGLYKIFDEILVNAADNHQRDSSMDQIQVTIDADKNTISVFNNGQGIPVEVHAEHGVYIPEMIFGELLTSSNYDDSVKKVTGGRNGYGAKLTNIFSTEFIVETSHKKTKRRFKQVFKNNMHAKDEPIINESKEKDYTKITFKPDLAKFKMTHLDEDIVALMTKRVYDVAGCNAGIKVVLNGNRLPVNSFKTYVQLYLPEDSKMLYEKVSDRWEVAIATTDGEHQQVSFVNSICTIRGGTHVEHVSKQVVKIVQDAIGKKNKGGAEIKPSHVKNHLWVFVKSLVENPAFDSQTKETLTTKMSDFGSKCVLTEDFLKKVAKSDLVGKVLQWTKFRESVTLVGKQGGKRKGKLNIAKLDDANNAGSKHAQDCTLIIVEGDSAKTQAVAGLGVVGRDNFGAFPLRGKMVNVRDALYQTISKNAEISHLVQILGLKLNQKYDDTSSLRYGHVMIMTDQDYDGSHIKGLMINFIHFFWPSLLKIPGFLTEFITPIVRISKGKKLQYFYTMPEFKAWVDEQGTKHGWDVKYLKGLGSSTPLEFKEFFSKIDDHRVDFAWDGDVDGEAIDMAFNKKRSDERKKWLGEYKPGTFLEQHADEITYSDFVNKELVLYSIADCSRSIPSLVDGLKPSQRKVMHACFKRNVKKETKVIQIAGYVMEMCAYHHGEASLYSTTIGLAQDFIGSNNVNLLYPGGSFGSRLQGGADASSPRYINTKLADITRLIFRQEDEPLLDYLVDDGKKIEPKWFAPIIPMVLVNGASGIGMGWSTSIPCHNPRDLVANIKRLLEGEQQQPMHPWYQGFKGTITPEPEKKRYNVYGMWKRIDARTIEITELPIGIWTQDYKEHLLSMITPDAAAKKQPPFLLKDLKEYHTDQSVHFIVESEEDLPSDEIVEKALKLVSHLSVNNMTMFDSEGRIRQWESATAILEEFYTLRLQFYDKRKEYLVDSLREEWKRLDNKVRFILAVVNKEIVINNRKKADILKELRDKNYDPFPTKSAAAKTKVAGDDVALESEDEGGDEEQAEEEDTKDKKGPSVAKSTKDYDYLLSMALWNLTLEKVQELVRQRDNKSDELKVLLGTSAKQLWLRDLDELNTALDERDALYAEDQDKQKVLKKKGGGGKLRARKGKKAAAKPKTDEDDEDFAVSKPKPKAAPKKPAPIEKPATNGASKAVKSGDEKKTTPKTTLQSYFAPVNADKEEDDENLTLAQRLAKKGKPSPFKDTKKASANTSDADDSDAPAAKKTLKRKSPAKKPKKTDDYDFDDEEEVKVTKKKPAAKRAKVDDDSDAKPKKKAPAKKPAIVFSDDESDAKPKKKAPAKKPAIVSDDESDAKPKKKAPAKKLAAVSDDDSDAKPKKKAPAKKSAKHSSEEDDSDAPVVTATRPSRTAKPKVDYSKMLGGGSDEDAESDISLFSE